MNPALGRGVCPAVLPLLADVVADTSQPMSTKSLLTFAGKCFAGTTRMESLTAMTTGSTTGFGGDATGGNSAIRRFVVSFSDRVRSCRRGTISSPLGRS